MTGDQCQGDQAANVICAVHMLGNTHAPINDGVIGRGINSSDSTDNVGVNAAQGGHFFG